MSNKLPVVQSLVTKLSLRLGIDAEPIVTINILKSTAFKVKDKVVSDEQLAALLIVADQYGLNPWTKEIYAFPDKSGGIVPVVGVDGWSRIINEKPQLNGIEFNYSKETKQKNNKNVHEWIECIIHRKDREKPTIIREYFDEVYRELSYENAWKSHPNRFHRHKTLIQCARVAFGFAGIYDEDEAERIAGIKDITPPKTENEFMPIAMPKDEAIDAEFTETIDTKTGEVLPTETPELTKKEFVQCSASCLSLIENKLKSINLPYLDMFSSMGIRKKALTELSLEEGNECLTWIRTFSGR